MNDGVVIGLLSAIVAVSNAFAMYFSWRARQIAEATKDVVVQTKEVIGRIEQNANGAHDALVKSTSEAAHAAGKEEGRLQGEAAAAILAKGILAEKEKSS